MKLITLLLFPVLSFSQIKFEKISILGDKVELSVPNNLKKMTDEAWTLKYGNTPKPTLSLSDENAEVNLIADLTKQPMTEERLVAYKDFRIDKIKGSHPEMAMTGNGIKTVNGKKVAFFKFITQATDQKIFNYYFFTIFDGKVLLFTFNCTESQRKEWEGPADEIVASLKLK